MSEEGNLPTAEEMRARYADLMEEDGGQRPEAGEAEPEAAPAEDDSLPSPEEMRARYADLMKDEAPADEAAAAPAPVTPPPATPAPEPEDDTPDPSDELAAHLLDVNVRLWAELGRARLPLAQTVALGTGAIVDLDKEPDEELDVLVNGMPFAKGKLLLVDGEWAIRLERIVATPGAFEQASNSGSGA
ncbi:MAG TPA: FliM/FliN family flagellar motor switch protein [Thermoleophilaceae bacterium]